MRPPTLTVLLLMAISLSSCSTSWQYMTLNSHEVTKDSSKRFTWENDTLRLVYDYSGYAGPVWMSISNKTAKPMYINWKKSAVIKGGYVTSLFPSNVQMTGSFDASRGYHTTSGTMAGSFTVPEGMDFIPPGSTMTKNIDVSAGYSVDANKLTQDPKLLKVKSKGYITGSVYKLYAFDEPSSPMQFKTYLTFVLDSENAKEFTVNHSFYASTLIVSPLAPRDFGEYKGEKDVLYLAQSNK